MDFGRLETVDGLEFALPSSPAPQTGLIGAMKAGDGTTRIFLGAPAWGSRAFVGTIYPPGSLAREYLKHYSRQFDTVELNTMYYRIPDLQTLVRWTNDTPDHFRFCPKFPKNLGTGPGFNSGQLNRFLEAIDVLGEKAGHSFLQLPGYFEFRNWDALRSFLDFLPFGMPFSVEFRHPSWFAESRLRGEVLEELTQRGIGAVVTDVAGRRDVLHMQITAPEVFVRFVGNSGHPSDYVRLDQWASQIAGWCCLRMKALYFIIHQPDEKQIGATAAYLARGIERHTGLIVRYPKTHNFPGEQGLLFSEADS